MMRLMHEVGDPSTQLESLSSAARAILTANDRGTHTVPAGSLYPHQWNWDSAFAALGHAALGNGDRAWRELETLAGSRLDSGMISHIAFDESAGDYMPGPAWWGMRRGHDGRPVSGISQPPVAGMCMRRLFEQYPDESRARPLLNTMHRWHLQLMHERAVGAIQEPVVVHPWESGRDNAPEWDTPLLAGPRAREPFSRVDTTHVDASQRPTTRHYEQYVGLVEWARDHDFDQRVLARSSPFRVLDPGFSTTLAISCDDICWLASQLEMTEIADESATMHRDIIASLQARVSSDGVLRAVDLVTDSELPTVGAGSAIGALAGLEIPRLLDALAPRIDDAGDLGSALGVRSTSARDMEFNAVSYWRGPVWANITWLCARGYERAGRTEMSERLDQQLLRYADLVGCVEYADPATLRGLGAADFTWTAALVADVLAHAPARAHEASTE